MSLASSDDFFLQYLKEMYKEQPQVHAIGDRGGFLEWVPNGSLISAAPPECLPENFEKELRGQSISPAEFGRRSRDYFSRCGEILSKNATGGLMGLVDFAMANYPFLKTSQFKPLVLQTKEGRSLNAFIGIKDQTPRPWVIYKCGVFCSLDQDAASIKNYMIHLFDQAPFNVIVLGNRTGSDYIVSNKVFNFGGYFESQDFFDVAEWLRYQSPYSHLVSSVHAVAVSLGGSAAFLTDQRLSTSPTSQRPLFQSVSSICAVSDLRPTVENMYGDTIKGFIFSRLTWHKLSSVKFALPKVEDLLSIKMPDNQEFPDLLGKLAVRYMDPTLRKTIDSSVRATPLFGSMIDPAINTRIDPLADREFRVIGVTPEASNKDTSDERTKEKKFWDYSQYSSYNHSSKVPLLVWASEDDSVVDYGINTGTLLRVRSPKLDPNLAIVGVPKGEHCGFSTAYGYSVTSTLLRSFIMMHSPEYQSSLEETVHPLSISLPSMIPGERIINYWWSLKNAQTLQKSILNLEIYGADDSLCPEAWAYTGADQCRRVVQLEFSDSYFQSMGFGPTQNEIEKEAFIRQLNGRLTLMNQGQTIIGGTRWPDQIQFRY